MKKINNNSLSHVTIKEIKKGKGGLLNGYY